MEEKQYYIYITTNLINGKQYIGKHVGFIDDNYLGSGINIKHAITKYGIENFKKDILYIASSEQEMNEKEKYYIDLYNAVKSSKFYNIADGGQGGYVTKGYTQEQRLATNKKISESIRGDKHPMYGRTTSEETKTKIKNSLAEYWTEERRQERSDQYKGENNPMYGKHQSQESIQKRIEHTDFSAYRTAEYRQKMSIATSGDKNGNYGNIGELAKNGRHILMYDKDMNLIREFNTKRIALEFLNIKGHTALDRAIKQKTLYKDYYWEQL